MAVLQQGTGYCDNCSKESLMHRRRPNHLLHFALNASTFGTWALIWLYFALGRNGWQCSACGSPVPGRAARELEVLDVGDHRPWRVQHLAEYRALEL